MPDGSSVGGGVPEIACINESSLGDDEIAWACKAVDAASREDFCPLHLDVPYQPVNFYSTKKDLPTASGLSLIFSFVDEIDVPGLAAYHSWAGIPFVKIGAHAGLPGVLLMHELVEESKNPLCNRVITLPGGTICAHELADPVQGWSYTKRVEMFGASRDVPVSAFVTDAWFTGAPGPTYFCPGISYDLQPGELAPGGYLPIKVDGRWTEIYGMAVTEATKEAKRAKFAAGLGRAARIFDR